ncbi:uncharacterized protein LOC127097216 [Lathyrus oleraceus]|uniref:uncharacterized protein LOC127097216 n=1 Tax=Pisum sativum TaxID=3888 RepID=UPI0021D0AEDD|nr:uncharacterized protein LOC127097216 [Pisum sativum]
MFYGASDAHGHGIGAIITSPTGIHLPFAARLCFDCINNMEEYEACTYGMKATIDLRIKILEVFGDLALTFLEKQQYPKGISITDKKALRRLSSKFFLKDDVLYTRNYDFVMLICVDRHEASTIIKSTHEGYEGVHVKGPAMDKKILRDSLAIEADPDDKPWFYYIKTFLEKQQYPKGISITDKKALRRLSSKFFLKDDVLYKRNYDFVLLKCVDRHEASPIIKSTHEGYEGVHVKGPAMDKKILRDRYYWTTMEVNCYNFVKRYHKCQLYGDKIFVPPTPLNVLTSPWLFSMWGIDMIEIIEPKASNGHRFILVDLDYFTNWIEAASYANVTRQVFTRFIKKEIICHDRIPSKIITNNSSNLNNKMLKELCEEFKIDHHNSSP